MKKNHYKKGDKVRLKVNVKDAYGEIWHEIGEVVEVSYIAKDGKGIMFASQLGTHFKNVDRL